MISGWRAPDAVVIVTNLLALAAVAALSIVSQPAGMSTPPLWPAAGIALGLGVCFPRRYLWFLAPAVAAVTLPVLLWAGRPPLLALALVAALAVEMAVGTLLLRGRRDRVPRLSTPGDLVLFLGLPWFRRRSTACSPSAPFRCSAIMQPPWSRCRPACSSTLRESRYSPRCSSRHRCGTSKRAMPNRWGSLPRR